MHPKVRGWMIGLSIVGIIYGALVSLMQKDMKKLVAYSPSVTWVSAPSASSR
jgi:NADH:ubiquinone oxidoreductase subunit 4 (subunit M)